MSLDPEKPAASLDVVGTGIKCWFSALPLRFSQNLLMILRIVDSSILRCTVFN